jgi:hypothetical protein
LNILEKNRQATSIRSDLYSTPTKVDNS